MQLCPDLFTTSSSTPITASTVSALLSSLASLAPPLLHPTFKRNRVQLSYTTPTPSSPSSDIIELPTPTLLLTDAQLEELVSSSSPFTIHALIQTRPSTHTRKALTSSTRDPATGLLLQQRNATVVHCACCVPAFTPSAPLSPPSPEPVPRPLAQVVSVTYLPSAVLFQERMDAVLGRQLALSLARRGHARIRLSKELFQIVSHMRHASERFFGNPERTKCTFSLVENGHRYGYYPCERMGKELFQVRLTAASAKWPTSPPNFRTACETAFDAMHDLGSRLVRLLCAGLCDDEHAWDSLCEGCSPDDPPLVSSLQDIFSYYGAPPNDAAKSCALHTDYGLLTLIPKAQGPPGLEVFDWCGGEAGTGDFCKIEELCGDMDVVIMAGQSLSRMTNIGATLHRVVVSDFDRPRLSTPFLLFANPQQMLDPSVVRPAFRPAEKAALQSSHEYCSSLIGQTESVTFGRLYNTFNV